MERIRPEGVNRTTASISVTRNAGCGMCAVLVFQAFFFEGTDHGLSCPTEFVTKMVDAGESKIFMSTRDTIVRAYMAGAILALAAAFAVTINVQTGQPLAGAILFPVGFASFT